MKRTITMMLLATAIQPLAAQGAGGAAQDFDLAVRAINQRIDRRAADAPLPRISDPQVARLFATASDSAMRFGTAAFPVRGMDSFAPVCGAPQALTARYMMFGVTAAEAKAPGSTALSAKANANVRAYQNEIFPLLRFSVRCLALHMPVIESGLAKMSLADLTQTRRDGLAQARLGIGQLLQGALGAVVQPGIRAENSTALLRQVAADAPALSRVLTLAQRAELLTTVARFNRAAPPALKGDVERLRAALADKRCEGLCTIP